MYEGFAQSLLHGARVRTDLGIKVFKVLSETDVWRDQVPYRQPDSNSLRRWEVAGTAHLDYYVVHSLLPLQTREFGLLPQPTCTSPPLSRVPLAFVSMRRSIGWPRGCGTGSSRPQAPTSTLIMSGVIVRDTFGNALGGIRLSQHAVATATNTGVNSPLTNACRTYGTYLPFDGETLTALCPNHGTYVSEVTRVAKDNLTQGFIVRGDAVATIRAAARAEVGR